MPEVVNAISKYNTLRELEAELREQELERAWVSRWERRWRNRCNLKQPLKSSRHVLAAELRILLETSSVAPVEETWFRYQK